MAALQADGYNASSTTLLRLVKQLADVIEMNDGFGKALSFFWRTLNKISRVPNVENNLISLYHGLRVVRVFNALLWLG